MLTATRFDHRGKRGKAFYEFKCECGNTKVLCGTDVSQGKTKSCGCNRIQYMREGHTRLPVGEASFNNLYVAYKGNAKSRKIEFSLSKEEFRDITTQPCTYCGIEPIQVWIGTNKKCSPYLYNGVDRVDNSQGYVSGNAVPCCKICNQAKHNMKLNDFIAWLDRILKFRTESGATSAGVKSNHASLHKITL